MYILLRAQINRTNTIFISSPPRISSTMTQICCSGCRERSAFTTTRGKGGSATRHVPERGCMNSPLCCAVKERQAHVSFQLAADGVLFEGLMAPIELITSHMRRRRPLSCCSQTSSAAPLATQFWFHLRTRYSEKIFTQGILKTN